MMIETPTGELVEARIEEAASGPVIAYGSGESDETFNPYSAFVRGCHLLDADQAELDALFAGRFGALPGVRELFKAGERTTARADYRAVPAIREALREAGLEDQTVEALA